MFREAQATVFRRLYGYWQDYQAMSHGLSRKEIKTEINKQNEKGAVFLLVHPCMYMYMYIGSLRTL